MIGQSMSFSLQERRIPLDAVMKSLYKGSLAHEGLISLSELRSMLKE